MNSNGSQINMYDISNYSTLSNSAMNVDDSSKITTVIQTSNHLQVFIISICNEKEQHNMKVEDVHAVKNRREAISISKSHNISTRESCT